MRFIIPGLLLLLLNTALAIMLVRSGRVHASISRMALELEEGYKERRLHREVGKYLRPSAAGMNLIEKIELLLIDKSNIRHYIPFMNFYTLLVAILAIFTAFFKPVYEILHFVPSTTVVCLIFSSIPILILDIMARYNSEKVRRKLAEFISVLNRWCAVKDDIFYAFDRSADSGLGEPLKSFVRDMVIQVNRGIEPVEALEILQMKVDNAQFGDFILNIKQSLKYRGDIRKLLSNLEEQFYKIEEEYNRRRISTYRDRLLIYFVMFAVLLVGYSFLKLNPQVEGFYLGTLTGKALLTLFSLLYISGLTITFGITRFKH